MRNANNSRHDLRDEIKRYDRYRALLMRCHREGGIASGRSSTYVANGSL